MKNSTYWAKRFKALEDEQHRKSADFATDLQKKFDVTRRELEDKLNRWYARLGGNTGKVTLADAKKLLKADELKEFHWALEEYRKYSKEHGLDPEWIEKLENASAKKHISQLESIELQMEQLEERLYAEYNDECYGYLGELVKDSYYRTGYEISKGTGIGINLHRLNEKAVEKYLTHPWCQDGKVFSDRIWARKDELVRTLDNELIKQLIIGSDPQKAIDVIADKFDVSKRQAGTLVMTESAAIASEASKDCMKDLGVEEYEILATLDSHTSEICQEMDGKHFKMSEYEPGLTAPPFHPNCRSTTIPYFDDEFTLGESRAARDKNDEGYDRVPADMTYKEWKEKYVDGKTKDEKISQFNKENDPLLAAMGSIEESNPGEMQKFIDYASSRGVEIDLDSKAIGYSPGLSSGQPGQLHVSVTDSYGAWKHEMQHLYDDEAAGWRGFAGLCDIDIRSQMEYNAYREEIKIALSIKREDIAERLKQSCKEEIEKIGGVWDEARLEQK